MSFWSEARDTATGALGGGLLGGGMGATIGGAAGATGNLGPLTDFIFGQSPSTETTSRSLLTPEQQAALNDLLPQLLDQIGSGPIGGLSGREQNIMDQLLEVAGQNIPLPGTNQNPLFTSAEEALMNIIGGASRTPDNFNEFFKTTVQDPLVKSFREDVLPATGIKFGTNFFGSQREDFIGKQLEDLTTTLATERSRLAYEDRNRAIQDTLNAAGIIPNITGAQSQQFRDELMANDQAFNQLLSAMGVAGTEREAILQDEQMRQNLINLLIGASTNRTIENTTVVNPGSSGALSNFLSGAGQGVGSALAGG